MRAMTVPQMFESISKRYDRINRVLSLGLDLYWRKAVCKYLPKKQKIKLLDCATGTGDQLVTLLKNCPQIYDAVGIDPAHNMLALAKPKLARYSHCARLAVASAEEIPFPDEMFNAITISFGIRNVADLSQSLKEIYRALAPEGRLIILEFSHPSRSVVRFFHRFYLNWIVPYVGKRLSQNEEAYNYLSKTIETFPQGDELAQILRHAGFTNVQIKPLSFGTVSLYIGDKNGSSTLIP
jgi:demethylmenaquinone methyltransferase/2-methoxy-6-polyprenyl-1,4-benzoquinol methylase